MKHVLCLCFIAACILSWSIPTKCENIFIDGSSYADSAQVSLFDKTSFVIRGTMSPAWNSPIQLTVTDPIKINATAYIIEGNRFEKTIPMQGSIQEMLLYLTATETMNIPVCAGDTIDITFNDDDLTLYSNNQITNLDLQLASTLYKYKNTKKYDRSLKSLSNMYRASLKHGAAHNSHTDSIKKVWIEQFDDYIAGYKTAIDTFIINHGKPRLEKYFRIAGFYEELNIFSLTDMVFDPQFKSTLYLDSINSNVPFNIYHDSFLAYPHYRNFAYRYASTAYPILLAKSENRSVAEKTPVNPYDIYCKFSPTQFFSDWINSRVWEFWYRHYNPEIAMMCLNYVYEHTADKEIKSGYAKYNPELARLSPGKPAPHISMIDTNGKQYTLDDFKGKYLYLDLWDFSCGVCCREFLGMPEFKKYFADVIDNVEIVTVCMSKHQKRLNDFVIKYNMDDLNLIIDPDNSDSCYSPHLFPTYIFIDPQGKIVEFNTERPSIILQKSKSGQPSVFEKSLRGRQSKSEQEP